MDSVLAAEQGLYSRAGLPWAVLRMMMMVARLVMGLVAMLVLLML